MAAAIELIGERVPDVVLVDVHMPDGGGQAVIEAVGRTHPDVRFLALSVSDAAEDVIGVIRAGARGYVTKTISGPELTEAIVRVADGDAVFSPGWPASSSTPSPPTPAPPAGRRPPSIPNSTNSPRANARSSGSSPAATPTRRWPANCPSRSRRWRATCRPSCASSSCRAATN